MNLNLFLSQGRWLMVDCGITFEQANEDHRRRPSIQMPDPTFISSQRDQLDGLVVTHAHEDHFGAIPYLWQELQCPVYATPFAAAVLRKKAAWRGAPPPTPLIEVSPGDTHTIGSFDVTWLPITHSTPETCALLLESQGTRILHTADWKIDTRPVIGSPWSPSTWKALAAQGIDAVICDSTNATTPGRSPTEGEVGDALVKLVTSLKGRVVVACFASNVARVQSVFRAAHASERRVGLLGRSLDIMVRSAKHAGVFEPKVPIIDAEHLGYLPENEVLAVATGTQGEIGAALHRLMMDTHPHLSLGEGDTVIFSSKTIPGNEESVHRLIEGLKDRGVSVIHADDVAATLHASGHPCQDELKDLYETLKPRLSIPVHGEKRHMEANASIARESGVPVTFTGNNGDLFYLSPSPGVRRKWAPVGRLQVDEKARKLERIAS
jgi:ribonuclease J